MTQTVDPPRHGGFAAALDRIPADAPAWLLALVMPLAARTIARDLLAQHRDTAPAELARRLEHDFAADPRPQAHRLAAAVVQRLRGAGSAPVPGRSWPSALVLLLANLVPLYGVLALEWPVFPLLVLFWIENLIVGGFNVLRMLAIDPSDLLLWPGKLVMVPFFCVHYGAFAAGHGAFVFGLFGESAGFAAGPEPFPVDAWIETIGALGLWTAAAVLALSHAFSFAWNFIGRREYRLAALGEQMMKPYKRVVILHVTIIVGGFGAMAFGSPLWALLLLLGLKIGIDLDAHLREHRAAAPAGEATR
jgi:hypothetical protein